MSPRPTTNPRLGALIRSRRQAAGLSLRGLADLCGVHYSALAKIEQGQVATPEPAKLRAIAIALGIDAQDLYALAGVTVPEGLPNFAPYLRSKYAMPDGAIDEMEAYFKQLRDRYGFDEGHDESAR